MTPACLTSDMLRLISVLVSTPRCFFDVWWLLIFWEVQFWVLRSHAWDLICPTWWCMISVPCARLHVIYLLWNTLQFFLSVRSKRRELQASIACLSFLIAGDLGFQKMHRTIIWTSYLAYQHMTLCRKPADIWQEMFQGTGRGVICIFCFRICTDLKVCSKTH